MLFYSRDEVPVTVAVIYSRAGGPELVVADPLEGIGGLLAGVGMAPGVGAYLLGGVGCHLHDVVGLVGLAGLDGLALSLDADHGVHEAVELLEGLTFGRLHHQCLVYGEGECGSMEAVVHQAFCDIGGVHSVVSLEVLQVYDALVGYASGDSGVVDVELLGQAGSQIVGVHYGHLGSLAQSVRTEQLDVGVGGAVRRDRAS